MTTIQGEKPITAIPTIYNGVQLRSRMEAKCAYLLDKLGWKWQYEPFSVMLDGIDYMPDFYIPERGYVVECRGYNSEKGERQIRSFSRMVMHGREVPGFNILRYVVIGPEDGITFNRLSEMDRTGIHEFAVQLCAACSRWTVWHTDGCDCGQEHCVAAFRSVGIDAGNITLDGKAPESWDSMAWSLDDAIKELIQHRLVMARAALEATGNAWLRRFISPERVIHSATQPFGLGIKWPPDELPKDRGGEARSKLDAVFELVDISPDKFWMSEKG